MESQKAEVAYEVLPYLRVYQDGHVERLSETEKVPPGFDPKTYVTSKNLLILPDRHVSARLYLPKITNINKKLPVLVYYHGGAFCLSSPSSPMYHNYLNSLVSKANVIAVSVNFRLPPEHRLPIAYEDSWAALQWVASHSKGQGSESWLAEYADFNKLFLAGDSSGANIAHNMAMLAGDPKTGLSVKILGIALVHPYFWGSKRIGSDTDDPRINPVGDGAPSLLCLGCTRVLVCVAGKDILKDRGWLYYDTLNKCGWNGVVEFLETEGEKHSFHLKKPTGQKANVLNERLISTGTSLPVAYEDSLAALKWVAYHSASIDPQTGVQSKDVSIQKETGLSARLYIPKIISNDQKLPLLIYFHGGGFFAESAFSPAYHSYLNSVVAEANVVVVSVEYRLAPEHPLPIAYHDSWEAIQWVASHSKGEGHEPWLKDYADFDRLFLAGDSAGANIVHNMALRAGEEELTNGVKILGSILVHPYFWGNEQIGSEGSDPVKNDMINKIWLIACPSSTGLDDPHINPVAKEAPSLSKLGCTRVLVFVAGKDMLRHRGVIYGETLQKSGWGGVVEIIETEGEDHVFHLLNPTCDKAKSFMNNLVSFMNHDNK
ncbi:hypothetical protein AQUCO_00700606v1 [Aquilegia coerulea]|uniref:Alpha/beta hydrolase fold-3 domain-containing protein n=1 Tax=Aquilegia coerulea TaxID=218851 RepID=A0A2G5EKW0_AQUCA|nr:hypothetical protein AQUCO_00700606v1 [Aquilegia coerulea]